MVIPGVSETINIVVSSLVTSIIAYLVLKLLKEDRNFFKVFIVVVISNVILMFLPYLSMLGIPIPWYGYLAISILITLIIYKLGLQLSWKHSIMLMIVTAIIKYVIAFILGLIGLGIVLSFGF
jgi:hypothetical protein